MSLAVDLFKSFRSPCSDPAQSGHRGVPTFVFEGEPFFRQRRLVARPTATQGRHP